MRRRSECIISAVKTICLLLLLCSTLTAQVRIEVDATNAPGRIFHSALTFPVKEGPLTLVYPKWFPGTHGPTGQISDLTGLHMQAGGKEIPWTRDSMDMFAFHCTIPAGANEMRVALDFVSPTDRQSNHHPTASSQYSAMISWTSLLLYPQDANINQITYTAALRLPDGWQYGTALKTQSTNSSRIEFAPVSLYTLVDSPVVAGKFFRTIDLNPGGDVPYVMHLAADSEDALQLKPETIEGFKNLYKEDLALYGAIHFTQYHFLVALSDPLKGGAVEHHECSDNRPPEKFFTDEDQYRYWEDTLPHEMTHSWNGKYRRPAGLDTKDYQQTIHSDLLWVYEGLTNYLGFVLGARSGLVSRQDFLDYFAYVAAGLDQRPGRTWRPLGDTTTGAQILNDAAPEWETWRRSLDYYDEGALIWLEVDTILRQKSGGSASLDDFCKKFFGGTNSSPQVKPYTREELEATLNSIVPYDWKQFFIDRIDRVNPHAPMGGIEQGGYHLKYGDTATPYHASFQKAKKQVDLRFSIGVVLDENGTVVDVLPESAAAKAKITPGEKILGVNGRRYSETQLKDAIRDSKTPIEFLVENADFYLIAHLDYHDGPKYPILEKDPNKPDLIHEITAPHRKDAKSQVVIETELGKIVVEVYTDKAPITAENFLRYVKEDRFKGATFYRVVTPDNQPKNLVKIEVIQGGLGDDNPQALPPISHETTDKTGILHKDGVISMARLEPGSASSEFFICIGDQPELDFGGKRNPDGQGFAAFGKVVEGMDVVRKIQQQPAKDQYLAQPVKITSVSLRP